MPITENQLDLLDSKLDDLVILLSRVQSLSRLVRSKITLPDDSAIELSNAQKQRILDLYDVLKTRLRDKFLEMP